MLNVCVCFSEVVFAPSYLLISVTSQKETGVARGMKNLLSIKGVDSSRAIISPCGSCKHLHLPRIHYMWRRDSFVFVQLGELSCNTGGEQLRAPETTALRSCPGSMMHSYIRTFANTVCTKLQGKIKAADSAFTAVFVWRREQRYILCMVSCTCAPSLPAFLPVSPSLPTVQLSELNKDGIK